MLETNVIYNESCLDTCRRLPDESIDCVITSPPYWMLRDYGYIGQWGLEHTFNEYLEHLWSLMDELYRILKPEGTVWINLGDTYNTVSGGIKAKTQSINKNMNKSFIESNIYNKSKEIRNKCLLLIPHRFAIGAIDRGWILRNDIVWGKRNGMPESVTDRFTKKHEYMFFFTKNEKYYFGLDAVREKVDIDSVKRELRGNRDNTKYGKDGYAPLSKSNTLSSSRIYKGYSELDAEMLSHKGKNPGDVSDFWDIPTKASRSSHYAVYNDELLRKPILAGCPENGIIYDPFMGSGTTAVCALRANRKFIGSEMSSEYYKLANKQIEPMLRQTCLF